MARDAHALPDNNPCAALLWSALHWAAAPGSANRQPQQLAASRTNPEAPGGADARRLPTCSCGKAGVLSQPRHAGRCGRAGMAACRSRRWRCCAACWTQRAWRPTPSATSSWTCSTTSTSARSSACSVAPAICAPPRPPFPPQPVCTCSPVCVQQSAQLRRHGLSMLSCNALCSTSRTGRRGG